MSKLTKIAGVVVSVGATTLMIAEPAMAASLLPEGALGTIGTDAKDTVVDLATQFIPIAAGILVGWFILSGSIKGMRKSGVK